EALEGFRHQARHRTQPAENPGVGRLQGGFIDGHRRGALRKLQYQQASRVPELVREKLVRLDLFLGETDVLSARAEVGAPGPGSVRAVTPDHVQGIEAGAE